MTPTSCQGNVFLSWEASITISKHPNHHTFGCTVAPPRTSDWHVGIECKYCSYMRDSTPSSDCQPKRMQISFIARDFHCWLQDQQCLMPLFGPTRFNWLKPAIIRKAILRGNAAILTLDHIVFVQLGSFTTKVLILKWNFQESRITSWHLESETLESVSFQKSS